MRFIAALLLSLLATPVSAEVWREAETTHFRIFSSGDEKSLVKFSQRLEQFHNLLLLVTGTSDANRRIVKVRVYLVPSVEAVKRLYGKPGSDVAGYYSPRDDGAIAVVPRSTGDGTFTGQLVLFHEYTHHYMLQYNPSAYPSWYVEGFAEIASTASFERKDAITFGKAAQHRQYELDGMSRYPASRMLDGSYIADREKDRGWSYGDAWLLTHFLVFDSTRRPQLRAYLKDIGAGRSHAEAAQAFGDLTQLQREVSVYLAGRSFPYRAIPIQPGAEVAVTVRELGAAEAELIDRTIEFERRTELPQKPADDEPAPQGLKAAKQTTPKPDFEKQLADAKKAREDWIAALEITANRFAGESAGWSLLADARCVSEQFEACAAAASRALAIDPSNVRALVRKAEAEIALARDLPDEEREAKVGAAQKTLLAAMAANPDDPLAQLGYYRSFAAMRRPANQGAIAALLLAVQLVPQQYGPRFALAAEWMARGQLRSARNVLRPVAFAPHESAASKQAQAMIAEIDAQLGGTQ